MPISWCELVEAMRERRLEWDRARAWDPMGRFVGPPGGSDEETRTLDEALRSLPPFRPDSERAEGGEAC